MNLLEKHQIYSTLDNSKTPFIPPLSGGERLTLHSDWTKMSNISFMTISSLFRGTSGKNKLYKRWSIASCPLSEGLRGGFRYLGVNLIPCRIPFLGLGGVEGNTMMQMT